MIFGGGGGELNIKLEISFSPQILSETFLILIRVGLDMITKVYWSTCKVPVILDRFNPLALEMDI